MRGWAGALVIVLAACDRPTEPTKAAPTAVSAKVASAPASPSDEAKSIARSRCASCHGSGGKGDGPNAATLSVKPRDLSAKDWQKSVSDAQIHAIIVKGGAGVGKSLLMPPNPDLEAKPEVVDALVKLVRGYGG
ncbi:MAG TPA: c-type cytochrome [Polyangiaceae bacterium]